MRQLVLLVILLFTLTSWKIDTQGPWKVTKGQRVTLYTMKAASQSDTQVDIKLAQIPVTSFIRLCAIHEKLVSNNSLERAEKLHKRSVISASTLEELTEIFDFLTYLRIKNQAYSISRHEAPGNTLRLAQLSPIEALTLKKIITDIASIQTFLGSVYSRAD